LHEKDQRVLLNFTDFEISMAESKIYADVEYYSPPILSDYVKTKVNLENLSPGKVFYYDSSDTIPNILNGFINGSLICDVTLSSDTNILDKVFIDQGNLVYETAKDTFRIKSLYLDAENIIYDLDLKSNPLATLTANCIIKANEINTGILKVNDVRYDIDVNKGEFTISPKQISFFGEEGHGTYILKPFAEIPTYELMYSVRQFEISQLLSSFLEDTIITGTANFKMDITMSGDHWDSVVSNINGDLYVSGTELTMYGLDADKLIEKLKRSQNFNLVDVGAVILAGPVGLAVTKGSDFARIIVANPGEQTFIPNFSSAWKVKNGRLIIEDVAFTTDNNRIAALGWIDLNTDSLNLTIAALNNKGCVIISQDLYGKLEEPEMSDVKVVKSLLAPVTNLVGGALGIDCKVFYEGEIEHPVKKRK
jgi:AsmA protein